MFTSRLHLRAALAATATVGLICLTGCGSEPAPAAGSPTAAPLVRDGNRWIGFLLSGNSRDAKIEFIEVSVGDQPGLLRDGC